MEVAVSNATDFLSARYENRRKCVELHRADDEWEGLRRFFTQSYPDEVHFIYELLQNAEDARAESAHFRLEPNRLVFEHDGERLFTRDDVQNITKLVAGGKQGDVNQIGEFGVGFKSVFAYTDSPKVFSGEYQFEIRDLCVPRPVNQSGLDPDTTYIELPFDHSAKRSDQAYAEVADRLRGLADSTLLFLNNIRVIEWEIEGESPGKIERLHDNTSEHHLQIRRTDRSRQECSHWLRFQESYEPGERLNIAVAFALEPKDPERYVGLEVGEPLGGEMRIKAIDGKLFLFFPAEKETTNLKFHIHGPYMSPPARDSIRTELGENKELLSRTAELLARSLSKIKDLGLLTTDCLAVLPNEDDELAEFYAPMQNRLVDRMQDEPLVPTDGGDYAPATQLLIPGSANIRKTITGSELPFFASEEIDLPDGSWPMWAAGTMRNQRAHKFIQTLEIREWTWKDLQRAVQDRFRISASPGHKPEPWLSERSDKWMQKFYALLEECAAESKRVSHWKSLKLIRLQDKQHVCGSEDVYFPEGEDSAAVRGLSRVRREIFEGRSEKRIEAARAFLERAGVCTAGEREELKAILDAYYSTACSQTPDRATHIAHIRRFVRWWLKSRNPLNRLLRSRRPEDLFDGKVFLLDGSGDNYCSSSALYLDSPYADTDLSTIFKPIEGPHPQRKALWSGYNEREMIGFQRFAIAMGVLDALPVQKIEISQKHPDWKDLQQDLKPGTRPSGYEISDDFTIENLDHYLSLEKEGVSRAIWKTMCSLPGDELCAVYRPNKSRKKRTAPSTLVYKLRKAAWIPGPNGRFYKPAKMTEDVLSSGFQYNDESGWLSAIGFGENALQEQSAQTVKQSAAEELGLSEAGLEIAEILSGRTPEEQRRAIETVKRELSQSPHPELPEREPRNPERRRQKIAERAAKADPKRYNTRKRSVRISGHDAKEGAKTYLRDLNSNRDSELLCQICDGVMPFKLENGEYYFEAVEVLKLPTEHKENNMALCPVCAAMYRYVRQTDLAEIQRAVLGTANNNTDEIPIVLANRACTIRFVQMHMQDLRSVLEKVGGVAS